MCEICSKLTIKISEQRHWRRSGVFIDSFEQISHTRTISISIVDLEQVKAGWLSYHYVINFDVYIMSGLYVRLLEFLYFI